jgi:hypothetical protein
MNLMYYKAFQARVIKTVLCKLLVTSCYLHITDYACTPPGSLFSSMDLTRISSLVFVY